MASLSVCMIVKNEAKNIGRCLESIREFADEIIVVDTGSVDDTKSIAEGYGAKIFDFEWIDDFSKARNYSLSKATGDWILILDGDDEFEKKDGPKLLALINDEKASDIYIFNTICYIGDRAGGDKIMNVNLRLFRNRPDFKYQGRIHESVISKDPSVTMNTADIAIYHYGYLNHIVKEQQKRERNMRILEAQLRENPENPYFMFCMGNEYFALNDFAKAQEYFISAYEKCNIGDVYVPKLIIRIIMAYQALGQSKDALKYIDIALGHYPQYTDVEFIRGSIYHRTGNFVRAIQSFEKCLAMGEPSPVLNFIIGVGGYRAMYALGAIYHQLNEYEEALKYYSQALTAKNDHYDSIYAIGNVICRRHTEDEEIKKRLIRYFSPDSGEGSAMLGDILFLERKYKLALEFFETALKKQVKVQEMLFLKGKSLFNLRRYEEAAKEFQSIEKNNKYYLNGQVMLLLCCYIRCDFEKAESVLEHIGQLDNQEKVYRLLASLGNILQGREKLILSEDAEESKEYKLLVLDILDAILCAGEFDVFEKALELFNCIESDEVLLALAKLYNKYGFIRQAVKEIKRSISIFDKIDEESSYILYRSFASQ